jgi:hypothetical protein
MTSAQAHRAHREGAVVPHLTAPFFSDGQGGGGLFVPKETSRQPASNAGGATFCPVCCTGSLIQATRG